VASFAGLQTRGQADLAAGEGTASTAGPTRFLIDFVALSLNNLLIGSDQPV